jgi:hypothetical protein
MRPTKAKIAAVHHVTRRFQATADILGISVEEVRAALNLPAKMGRPALLLDAVAVQAALDTTPSRRAAAKVLGVSESKLRGFCHATGMVKR